MICTHSDKEITKSKISLISGCVLVTVAMIGCGGGDSSVANSPPIANAGSDQIANERSVVVLMGTGTDSDGMVQDYLWTQQSGPSVALSNAAASRTEFTAPSYSEGQSTLVFRLTVTDDAGASGSDDTMVSVNARPTVSAGTDQVVVEDQQVSLKGRGEDRDGTIQSFLWSQETGPNITLENATEATATFTAPTYVEGNSDLLFQLSVTDNRDATATDEVKVSVSPPKQNVDDPFAHWNDLEPESWWRESEPYTCKQQRNSTSPWEAVGMTDLGGSDSLSLIRYFGNGSYLRYGHMGFAGCTPLVKYPDSWRLDPPADPTYYSLGDLDIHVDIARVPADATGWVEDDGDRIDMSMDQAVSLLNTYVGPYFRRVSEEKLRITFHAGNEFEVGGDGSPSETEDQQFRLAGACLDGCTYGAPGGLNRILLPDVASDSGGRAYNGWAAFGLVSLRDENMETIVHEMGHAWMAWPHSYSEVGWKGNASDEVDVPNPYSNFFDIISALDVTPILGWDVEMPSTLAINRYAAGWIEPKHVALHVTEEATYTLSNPREAGFQFLVIHSGREYAFTTVEVLEERTSRFIVERADVYDHEIEGNRRARRYEGVLVSRYDQSAGTGANARFGPALYDERNPDYLIDVGWGRDDYSLLSDGDSRDIGGGVKISASKNSNGSWNVDVTGGRVADFPMWCEFIWFSGTEFDTGCLLDKEEDE